MKSSKWLRRCTGAVAAWAACGAASGQPVQGGAPSEGVAYVTNQGDGVSVLDLATLRIVRQLTVGTDPRGLAISPDGRLLLTANQGDGDVSAVDTASGRTIQRVPIGKNAEFIRISPDGRAAYVTYEPSSSGKPPGGEGKSDGKQAKEEGNEPAEIAVIDLASFKVTARLPASLETEGMDFSADGRQLVVANEGDDSVVVYDRASGQSVQRIDLSSYGKRPRGVKVSPDGTRIVVTLESSDNLAVLDAQYHVIKTVPTGKGPYGVAYQPGGSRLWVAAARSGQVQVLDAMSFEPVASIPVGKRCWHFTFMPDGARALVACGRSDSVVVIDAIAARPLQTLEHFQQPWGIVTYPKASGSLDSPVR